jgi:hypothetical protein
VLWVASEPNEGASVEQQHLQAPGCEFIPRKRCKGALSGVYGTGGHCTHTGSPWCLLSCQWEEPSRRNLTAADYDLFTRLNFGEEP